jgi:hypothetical protein
MAWLPFDAVMFAAHRRGPLVEADFAKFVEDLFVNPQLMAAVVFAADAAPSARQRGELIHWFDHGRRRAAIVTDSVIARGGVTALSWFGAPIRAFATQEVAAALSFVNIAEANLGEAIRVFRELVMTVEAPAPA